MKALCSLIFLGFIAVLSSCSMKDSKQSLDELFSDYKEFILREYPISATYDGDHRYDDRLTDYSETAIKARFDSLRVFLERAEKIDISNMHGEDSLSLLLFIDDMKSTIEAEQFNDHYMPITQQDGIHIEFPQIIEIQPFKTVEDYNRYVNRLSGFSKQVDDIIVNMRKGMKAKIVLPYYIVQQILDHFLIHLPMNKKRAFEVKYNLLWIHPFNQHIPICICFCFLNICLHVEKLMAYMHYPRVKSAMHI
jgi:uncharacterized protein (DUF885 family)